MTDSREPLPEGTVLRCSAAEYRISGAPIGCGGSSIVYPVLRAGESSHLAVKEGFPLLLDGFGAQRIARVAGVAAPAAPDDADAGAAMRRLAQSLRQEKEISQRISRHSAHAVELREQLEVMQIVLPDGTAYDGQAGLFFLMDDVSGKGMSLSQLLDECALAPAPGHPLRTGGLPAPAVSAAILITGARAAELVTAGGYLHGDIQLHNLLLLDARTDGADAGFGVLLDYSCARPFEPDGRTAPVVRREAFSTPGFTPPELALGEDETVRLGPQADVYSLGRLLLYLLTGQTFYERRYDGSGYDSLYGDPGRRTLRPSEARRLGVRGGALRLLNHILLRALDEDPEKRYPTPAALRADAERLAAVLRAPGLSLAPSLPHSPDFCPRPALFSALRTLAEWANPLWLCGEAGTGKTELAVCFGEYLQEKQNRPVCFVRYEGSLRDALLCVNIRGTAPDVGDAAPDLPDRRAPIPFPAGAGVEELEKTLCTLEREFDGCLLIVDGFFDKDRTLAQLQREPAYRMLRAHPGIQVLFTTRYAVPADSVTVGPMTDAELLTVLHAGQRAYGSGELSFYPDGLARDAADPYRQPRPEPEEDTTVLLPLLAGSPLLADLAGRSLANFCCDPKKLARAWRERLAAQRGPCAAPAGGARADAVPADAAPADAAPADAAPAAQQGEDAPAMPASLRALFDLCVVADHFFDLDGGHTFCGAAFLPAGGLMQQDFPCCEDVMARMLIRRGWLHLDAYGRCTMPEPVQALCLEVLTFSFPHIQKFFEDILQLALKATQQGDLRTRRTALRMLVRSAPDILRFAPQPGDPYSCRRTAQPPDGGPENELRRDMLTLLERAAEMGNGAAAYAAAEMHRRGEGCRPNSWEWKDWLGKAVYSSEPSSSACYLLGCDFLKTPEHTGIGNNRAAGLMLLQRAVELGCPELDEAGLAALRAKYAPPRDPI